ncbi:alkaline phosphatase family protein [soil metagenome]
MTATKLLVLGLDAADQDLMLGWAQDGSLPHFARLMETGSYCEMLAPPGQYAGSIWPSIHTGCSPARHGRYFHQQLQRGTYGYAKFLPPDLKEAPFWERLSRAGRRVAILDVPKAPVARELNGLQLLDWGAHDPEYDHARSCPESLASEIEARHGKAPIPSCDTVARDAAGLPALRDGLLERIRTKAHIIEDLLGRGPWDLLMAVFSESHCAGHQFWRVHDQGHPQHDPSLARSLGDPLKDVYVALDEAIGQLVDGAGPDTRVVVFSSHGMGPHYDGTFLLRDIVRRLHAAEGRHRSAPVEALRWLWRRLPRAARKRSRSAAVPIKRSLDHEETTDRDYFVVPTNDNCAGIRINLEGREPQGRVPPGRAYDELCAKISERLLEIVNVESGEPLVRRILRSGELFKGPYVDDLPDLNIVWNRSAPVRKIRSPGIGTIEHSFAGWRSGDHRSKGFVLVRDPQIGHGSSPAISAMDLAPTLCAWFGVELDADGSPAEWGHASLNSPLNGDMPH